MSYFFRRIKLLLSAVNLYNKSQDVFVSLLATVRLPCVGIHSFFLQSYLTKILRPCILPVMPNDIFRRLCFRSVCLSVSPLDYSKSYEWILMKFLKGQAAGAFQRFFFLIAYEASRAFSATTGLHVAYCEGACVCAELCGWTGSSSTTLSRTSDASTDGPQPFHNVQRRQHIVTTVGTAVVPLFHRRLIIGATPAAQYTDSAQ